MVISVISTLICSEALKYARTVTVCVDVVQYSVIICYVLFILQRVPFIKHVCKPHEVYFA